MHIGQAKLQSTRRSTPGFRVATSKPPREQLKDLIDRSGLTLSEVSKRMGFPHTSNLHRYTREAVMGDNPINVGIVRKLMPVIKGLGDPPITVSEIMALTSLPAVHGLSLVSQPVVSSVSGVGLELRYIVDQHSYKKLETARVSSPSPICSTPEYDAGNQFVAVDGKEYLHCVDKNQFDPRELMGRRVVVAVPYEKTGLYSIEVGRVSEKMKGIVLGVVIGSYTRE